MATIPTLDRDTPNQQEFTAAVRKCNVKTYAGVFDHLTEQGFIIRFESVGERYRRLTKAGVKLPRLSRTPNRPGWHQAVRPVKRGSPAWKLEQQWIKNGCPVDRLGLAIWPNMTPEDVERREITVSRRLVELDEMGYE